MCCALLDLPVRYAADVLAFVLACQDARGGRAHCPVIRSPTDRRPGLPSLPSTVWLIGLISLVDDSGSELLYPLLPLYLSSVLMAGPRALGASRASPRRPRAR